MKIKMVSHASVIIDTEDCVLWTDPWLFGEAFNSSWKLYPPASMDNEDYERIGYIWISHEHPDHFHIPSLLAMPDRFKERVLVLYQQNNSDKIFDTLRKIGFCKFRNLPHRRIVELTPSTKIYCYQVGNMDSVLSLMDGKGTIVNINDAEMSRRDCRIVYSDVGNVDVVLNQFSVAGYSGQENRDDYLPKSKQRILENISRNHIDINARFTIPFASFIYFCKSDNFYMNEYSNTIFDVLSYMKKKDLSTIILYPGDGYTLGESHSNDQAKKKFKMAIEEFKKQGEVEKTPAVSVEKIEQAFYKRYEQIKKDYWGIFLSVLAPVSVHIPDLEINIIFSMRNGNFQILPPSDNCDLTVYSQPLFFTFEFPYGCQTLGVSARYVLRRNESNWKRHRILFSLNNAEIYLSTNIFRMKNILWLVSRLRGIFSQLLYQLYRM